MLTFTFCLAHAISSTWETVVVKGEADVERVRARMWLDVFVCAECAWDWDPAAEHSTIGAHVREGEVRNSVSSLPLWYSCTLCAVGTHNAAKESKQWKRRGNRPLLIKFNQDYKYVYHHKKHSFTRLLSPRYSPHRLLCKALHAYI